ncbi:hypothetical protein D1872_171520 [compost metagenome]
MTKRISDFLLRKPLFSNYDPKKHSIEAYILARQKMLPADAVDAIKIFALSNFFTFAENLSHDQMLSSDQVRSTLKKKLFEFGSVLDLTVEECEKSLESKTDISRCKERMI